ncbi:TonB-linked outer membrane protein, SusC/RagA family [Mariniphaga anaerophila]|uniref:TonB-linked outer membrane protein, SusC/RagA family n=2 Tax=Mariniphaga anaerophila TaxID=1484053 RepID=A0A1M4ZW92_9BACT|nr:TonB-linked outer membrane protein, SusC/RagA family [Mariniphaga anaerophila]
MKLMLKNSIGRIFAFILLSIILTGLFTANVNAQQTIKVSGTVTSAADETPLPGLSIIVKGTSLGTITNSDGSYTINAPADGTLTYSFVGFQTQEVAIQGRSVINVSMQESIEALEEVVVTALGIKREEKSLGYSVAKVDGPEFTRVAQENFLNSMSGKVAGVTINQTGGTGSTTSIIIRGAKSLSNDNQPLYVVDGVPLASGLNNVGGFGSGNPVDYGNSISDLDPESIESVSVLKGPSATALYGSRAGNGVIIITTKRASGTGMKVSVTSNTTFDIPSQFLNVQKQFATGYFSYRPEDVGGGYLPPILDQTGIGPELDKGYWAVQWNSPRDANGVQVPTELVSYPNNVKNFLNDYAYTTTNGVAISNTSEAINYRLGYTNMTHQGLIPNSDLNRNNLSLSASSKVKKNLTVSTTINFVNSFANNRPAGNRGTNPLQWAYFTPPYIDINELRDYDIGQGNTIKKVIPDSENPWMLANDVNNSFNRYQVFGNVMATWEISPKFSLMGRMTLDKTDQVRETKIGLGYSDESFNGAYGISNSNSLERNIDGLFTYKDNSENFAWSFSVGGNTRYAKGSSVSNSSKNSSGLTVPNLFTLKNIPTANLDYSSYRYELGVNSLYGMANLSWRETIYLDITARNDWSSTLRAAHRSYFYPSASLSILLNELMDLGSTVNLLKIRGGIAQTGNDTSPYNLLQTYGTSEQWGDAIRLNKPGSLLNKNLKPEMQVSQEYGIEARLFGNRLRLDATYYTLDNKDMIFNVSLPTSTGFSGTIINAGLVQSKGVELMLGGTPVKNRDWSLDLNLNFTKNVTRIIELADGIPFVTLWDQARVRSIGYAKGQLVATDQFGNDEIADGIVGNLYSRKVNRVTDKNSEYYMYPLIPDEATDTEWDAAPTYSKIGNVNPNFIMGLQSTLSWKNFSLNMTFDWRNGGQYVSQTYRYLTEDMATNHWFENLVYPGVYDPNNPGPSDELRDWVVANADKLIYPERLYPVGGPSPEYGGFPEQWSGTKVYDGTFVPGVIGSYDENGNFILERENLGNPGTVFLPYSVSYPWSIGQANVFDADYIKLREISLSYKIPRRIVQKLYSEDINVSVYSRNIILWTKDSGFGIDPERAYQPDSGKLLQGLERFNVNPWVIPIGFKLNFTF